MCRRIPTVVVLTTLALSSMALTELAAQEFQFTGGAVKGTQVKTNNASVKLKTGGAHVLLGSSTLTVHVAAGEEDLFVFEFDGECSLYIPVIARRVDPAPGDYVSLQARINGLLTGPLGGAPFLQPQNAPTDLRFCASPFEESVSKSWVVKLAGGASGADWTFSIWWRVVGQSPNLVGTLNDRTVRLTRYN